MTKNLVILPIIGAILGKCVWQKGCGQSGHTNSPASVLEDEVAAAESRLHDAVVETKLVVPSAGVQLTQVRHAGRLARGHLG